MNRRKITTILICIFVSAFASYWLDTTNRLELLIRDYLYAFTVFPAVIAGYVYLKRYGTVGARSQTVLLLTAGMISWLFGEAIWNYYEIVHLESPFPSVADIFYLLAYPLFFASLINEVQHAGLNWKKLGIPVLFLIGLVSLLLMGIVLYFGVYLAYDATLSTLANVIAIGYGLGDLLLIIMTLLVLMLAWEFRGGKLARVWLFICISFGLVLASDILFALNPSSYINQDFYYRLGTDSMWMIAYLLIAYALFDLGFALREVSHKIMHLRGSKEKAEK